LLLGRWLTCVSVYCGLIVCLHTYQPPGFQYSAGRGDVSGTLFAAAFLDADEFIVLDGGVPSLPGLLQPREQHAGVILHWRMFGHSGHMLRPQGGVLSSYTACCDAGWGSRLYKSIVQPALVEEYVSPHNFRFQEGHQAVDTWGRPAPHPNKAQVGRVLAQTFAADDACMLLGTYCVAVLSCSAMAVTQRSGGTLG